MNEESDATGVVWRWLACILDAQVRAYEVLPGHRPPMFLEGADMQLSCFKLGHEKGLLAGLAFQV